MKAFFRKADLEAGYVPDYTFNGGYECEIDWSKSYESWQPDCLDIGLNEGNGYNMVLLVFDKGLPYLVWVNSIDFDWEEETEG